LYKAIQAKKPWPYFLTSGILLGIALQLHYLALFLAVIVTLYTFFGQWYQDKKIHILALIKHYLLLLGGFLIGFSPFLAFEVRHGFPNTKTIFTFIFGDTLQGSPETHCHHR
jgi:dolichyl-phosphate-mannose--protein O-mannosyl transferase